ncbi:MAG: hypothetical protein IPL86_06735 [Flavobacteriales bacterium]|nr:hypothetical protein [Flavobacteriales bacterium]
MRGKWGAQLDLQIGTAALGDRGACEEEDGEEESDVHGYRYTWWKYVFNGGVWAVHVATYGRQPTREFLTL